MASHDKNGRQYVKYADLQGGKVIEIDDGFTCARGGLKIVHLDEHQHPYFVCDEGRHLLCGQDDGDGYCVGVYMPKELVQT